jgi:hypothetical protein
LLQDWKWEMFAHPPYSSILVRLCSLKFLFVFLCLEATDEMQVWICRHHQHCPQGSLNHLNWNDNGATNRLASILMAEVQISWKGLCLVIDIRSHILYYSLYWIK